MSLRTHFSIIGAIVGKDLREFSRDRFWMVLTPIALVAYIGLFWLLPATVDETISVGVYQRGLDAVIAEIGVDEASGLEIVEFASPAALEAAVDAGDRVSIGIAFPDDLLEALAAGRQTTVTLFVDAAVPNELQTAVRALVREIAFELAGVGLPVTQPGEELVVLGEDRIGRQVSPQEEMRPLLVFFVLLVESLALAGLVAVEVQARTAKAITVTPATVAHLLAAKGITGTLLAFGQAVILLVAIASFGNEPLLLLGGVLVGAIMVSGVGMIAGSAGRDFMTTLFTSVVLMVPLAIPAIAALFPGTASGWVQVLPTYGVVQTIVGVTIHGFDWAEAAGYLAMAAGWCVALFGAGWIVLQRRVEALERRARAARPAQGSAPGSPLAGLSVGDRLPDRRHARDPARVRQLVRPQAAPRNRRRRSLRDHDGRRRDRGHRAVAGWLD
ncbi:MAG: ABC transporter permease [Chloroflexi bacterium]|nr:ABC transporter permease [Chloroflexota bacterium]